MTSVPREAWRRHPRRRERQPARPGQPFLAGGAGRGQCHLRGAERLVGGRQPGRHVRPGPAAQTGAAVGLLRTFMYLGAIASAGITGFAFGARAADAGLHHLAVILTSAPAAALAAILLDRALHSRAPAPARRAEPADLPRPARQHP